MKLVMMYASVLAGTVAMAVLTVGALISTQGRVSAAPPAAKTLSPSDQVLFKTGKTLFNHDCAGCHGADLKGTDGFAPSLLPKGPISHYNSVSFMTLMKTDVGYDGKKLNLPMAGKLKDDEIKAIYVYISNH